MRLSINLATRPFVELRPVFARLRIAMAALAVLGVALGVGTHLLERRAEIAKAQMDALREKTLAFQNERQANERRMQQPQNRAVLDRSKFLNALFTRKSFSWTSVMMDLEGVLPAGVQVTSIEPVVTPEGEVNIRLRVNGDRDRAVELVRNLEQSHRFLSPRLANETARTQEEHGGPVPVAQNAGPAAVEFDIMSGYNPLPAPKKDAAKDKDKDAAKDKGKERDSAKKSAPKTAAPRRPSSPGTAKPGKIAKPGKRKPAQPPAGGAR